MAVLLAGLVAGSNAMCADIDTLKALPTLAISEVSSVKGLCEQFKERKLLGSVYGVTDVVWNGREVTWAIITDVTNGKALEYVAFFVKETSESKSIFKRPAVFCNHGLALIAKGRNAIANPGKAMSDSMSYVCQLLYAVSVIATDSDVVRFLNDKEVITRLKTVKAD